MRNWSLNVLLRVSRISSRTGRDGCTGSSCPSHVAPELRQITGPKIEVVSLNADDSVEW